MDDRGHLSGCSLLGGYNQCLSAGGGIAVVGVLHGYPEDRARVQIDGVLGLVDEMHAAVFHLRDTRVGIVRMPPLGIATSSAAFDRSSRRSMTSTHGTDFALEISQGDNFDGSVVRLRGVEKNERRDNTDSRAPQDPTRPSPHD
jgi:hypothetical protein